MGNFFGRLTRRQNKKDDSSAAAARERLRLVLVNDRMNLPPEKMQAMKEEILAVIARYIPLDSEEIDIALTQRDEDSNKLIAEVPFSKHAYAAAMHGLDDEQNDTNEGETLMIITVEDDQDKLSITESDDASDADSQTTEQDIP